MAIIWTGSQKMKFLIAATSSKLAARGGLRAVMTERATTADSCLLHEKQLLARYDEITCAVNSKYFSRQTTEILTRQIIHHASENIAANGSHFGY